MGHLKYLLAATLLAAAPAQAKDIFTIANHSDWTSGLNVYDDGMMACFSSTKNDQDHIFNVTIYQDHKVKLWMVFLDEIERDFATDIQVDVGPKAWNLSNAGFKQQGDKVYVHFTFPVADAASFLDDLAAQNIVAFRSNEQAGHFARWSLAGSKQALEDQLECAERIMPLVPDGEIA